MGDPRPKKYSEKQLIWGTVGLTAGGVAPLVTGIIGVWSYVYRGYIITRAGEKVTGLSGVITSVFFILAGIGLIGYALWFYRRNS